MIEINLALAIGGAVLHAVLVTTGLYIAVNTRIARLEAKMDVLWQTVLQWLRENGKKA